MNATFADTFYYLALLNPRDRRRPDKDWPLTDCISFIVMQDRSITEALTGDVHFRQAGFAPLLLQP